MKGRFIIVIIISFWILSCKRDIGKLPFCDANAHKFNTNIQAIISNKCSVQGCHVAGYPFGDFSNYDGVKLKVDKGTFKNYLFDLKAMPPVANEQLTETELGKIQCWLDAGAPNN